jgi:hypothetical protein
MAANILATEHFQGFCSKIKRIANRIAIDSNSKSTSVSQALTSSGNANADIAKMKAILANDEEYDMSQYNEDSIKDTELLFRKIPDHAIAEKKYIPGKSLTIGSLNTNTIPTMESAKNIVITITDKPTIKSKSTLNPWIDQESFGIFTTSDLSSDDGAITIIDLHESTKSSDTDIYTKIVNLFKYKDSTPPPEKYVWKDKTHMFLLFDTLILLLTFDIFCYNQKKKLFNNQFDIINDDENLITNPISVDSLQNLEIRDIKPTFLMLLIYYSGYNFNISTTDITTKFKNKFQKNNSFAITQYIPDDNSNELPYIAKHKTNIDSLRVDMDSETLELFHVGSISSLWDYVNGKLTILIYNMLRVSEITDYYSNLFNKRYASTKLFLYECIQELKKYKQYISNTEILTKLAFPISTLKTIDILLVKLPYILSIIDERYIATHSVAIDVTMNDKKSRYVINSEYETTNIGDIGNTANIGNSNLTNINLVDYLTNNEDSVITKMCDLWANEYALLYQQKGSPSQEEMRPLVYETKNFSEDDIKNIRPLNDNLTILQDNIVYAIDTIKPDLQRGGGIFDFGAKKKLTAQAQAQAETQTKVEGIIADIIKTWKTGIRQFDSLSSSVKSEELNKEFFEIKNAIKSLEPIKAQSTNYKQIYEILTKMLGNVQSASKVIRLVINTSNVRNNGVTVLDTDKAKKLSIENKNQPLPVDNAVATPALAPSTSAASVAAPTNASASVATSLASSKSAASVASSSIAPALSASAAAPSAVAAPSAKSDNLQPAKIPLLTAEAQAAKDRQNQIAKDDEDIRMHNDEDNKLVVVFDVKTKQVDIGSKEAPYYYGLIIGEDAKSIDPLHIIGTIYNIDRKSRLYRYLMEKKKMVTPKLVLISIQQKIKDQIGKSTFTDYWKQDDLIPLDTIKEIAKDTALIMLIKGLKPGQEEKNKAFQHFYFKKKLAELQTGVTYRLTFSPPPPPDTENDNENIIKANATRGRNALRMAQQSGNSLDSIIAEATKPKDNTSKKNRSFLSWSGTRKLRK